MAIAAFVIAIVALLVGLLALSAAGTVARNFEQHQKTEHLS